MTVQTPRRWTLLSALGKPERGTAADGYRLRWASVTHTNRDWVREFNGEGAALLSGLHYLTVSWLVTLWWLTCSSPLRGGAPCDLATRRLDDLHCDCVDGADGGGLTTGSLPTGTPLPAKKRSHPHTGSACNYPTLTPPRCSAGTTTPETRDPER